MFNGHRKGVCEGYSQLFAALAKAMNLEVYMVVGKASIGIIDQFNNRISSHAWNSVKLDGKYVSLHTIKLIFHSTFWIIVGELVL